MLFPAKPLQLHTRCRAHPSDAGTTQTPLAWHRCIHEFMEIIFRWLSMPAEAPSPEVQAENGRWQREADVAHSCADLLQFAEAGIFPRVACIEISELDAGVSITACGTGGITKAIHQGKV